MKNENHTLLIHQVVMDQSQDVTLFCQFGDRNAPLSYLGISLRKLNELLMEIGVGGLKLLESMAYEIMECNEAPSVVPVSNTLGLPLVVDVPSELIYASDEKDVYFYG
jgi:hypothetical protein